MFLELCSAREYCHGGLCYHNNIAIELTLCITSLIFWVSLYQFRTDTVSVGLRTTAVIGVRFLAGEADFCFLHCIQIDASGHPGKKDMLAGGKAARCGADHSPPSQL
jgi:hypothetical protein